MKHNIFFKKNLTLEILILLSIFSFSSCSKNQENLLEDNNTAKLIINVEGVNDENIVESSDNDTPNKVAKFAFAKSTKYSNGNISTEIENSPGFNLESTTIQAPTGTADDYRKIIDVEKGISAIASTKPMTAGKTYRVLIYKNQNPNLWHTVEAIAGTPIKLDITKGDTYYWYAYSYNNTESLPIPTDTQNPNIDADVSKDLLVASGSNQIPLNANSSINNPFISQMNIVFTHKMAQIKIRIDGRKLSKYANILGLKASFTQDNYIKNGKFNLKGNSMGNLSVVPTTEIFNTGVNPDTIWEATYYTADPASLTNYKVKITDLPVTFKSVDPSIATVNLATFTNSASPTPPNLVKTHSFNNPAAGQTLLGIVNLSYTFPSRRILHVSSGASYGYAMERNAGWKVINDKRNFGIEPNSLVRMQPSSTNAGGGPWIGGGIDNNDNNFIEAGTSLAKHTEIANKLTTTNQNELPDIVIFGHDMYNIRPILRDALINYVNKGGVFMMMYERSYDDGRDLIAGIFGVTATSLTMESLGGAGTMYRLLNVDDPVLNGPFGDARGKLWGEDASTSYGVIGLPANNTVIYSYGQGFNRSANATNASAVSMFRHKTKNFFYLGDGGLTSYNGGTSATICPFDYNASTGRPVAKLYGSAGNGYSSRSDYAYNSIIAGNIMLWAAELAEFKGIKPWRYKAD